MFESLIMMTTYHFSYNPKYQEITVSKRGQKSFIARVKEDENYVLTHENIYEFEVSNQQFFKLKHHIFQATLGRPFF